MLSPRTLPLRSEENAGGDGREGEEDENDSEASAHRLGSSSRGSGQGLVGASGQSPVAASRPMPAKASRRAGGPPAALGACQEQLRPRGLEPGGLAPLVAGAVALHQGARGHDLGIGGDHAETGAATVRHRRLDLRHDGVLGLGHPRGRDGSRRLGLVQRAALRAGPGAPGRARASVQRCTP